MSVFQKPDVLVNRNAVVFPEFDYLQRNLSLNNKALEKHIETRSMFISNSNVLGQIIYGAPERDAEETDAAYFNRIKATSIGRYTSLGIVSENGYGKELSDGVYTDINEYYLAVESEYETVIDDIGVTIISHPLVGSRVPEFTAVDYVARLTRPKDHYAYFTINFAKLVLNYDKYVTALRANLPKGEEPVNTINRFLQTIVFPSLVSQHVDLVFLNKLTRLITGEAFLEVRSFTDLSLADYSSKVDDILDDYTDHITGQLTSLDQLLMLELPSGKIIWDLLLPEETKLQQTHWFYVMANSRLMSYLMLILNITGISTEMDEVNELKREIKDLGNHRTVLSHMSKESKAQYQNIVRRLTAYSKDL